jgi:hypothetical protein
MKSIVGLGVVLIACGSRNESRPDGGVAVTDTSIAGNDAPPNEYERIVAACAAQVDALCRDFDTCAIMAQRQRFANEKECRTRGALQCASRATLPGVVDPVRTIERCTVAMREAGCDPWRRGVAWFSACWGRTPAFRGSLPTGAQCFQHEQCAGGQCSGLAYSGELCGTCTDVSLLGESCAMRDCATQVSPYWKCDRDSKICVPGYAVAFVGEACATGVAECVSGLDCRDGKCVVGKIALGEECGAVGSCAPGLFCSPALDTAICQRVEWVGVGEKCDPNGGDPTATTYRYCLRGLCTSAGTCDPWLALGERCDGSLPGACGLDAQCAPADGIKTCQRTADNCK